MRGATWVALLILLRSMLLAPGSSQAAVSNCGDPGPHFDGAGHSPGDYSVRGASADIEVRDPAVCTSTSNTHSLAWSMVANSDAFGWAQIGYIAQETSPLRFLWQWVKDYRNIRTVTALFGNPVVGSDRIFKVERQADSHLHMILGNDQAPCNDAGDCAETNFDPLDAWPGTDAQWYGETEFKGSDVPGVLDHKVDFDAVRVKHPGDVWSPEPWTGQGGDFCFYRFTKVDDNHFKIWTQPLDHTC